MRISFKQLVVGSLLLVGAGACADLEVTNLNDPDAGRSLTSAGDVESLIGGAYNSWFNGTMSSAGPGLFLSNQAFQHNAPWSNRGMEQYGRLPRVGIVNDVADNYYGQFTRPWYYCYRAIAAVSDGFRALEDADIADELGAEAVARARAYGNFVLGVAHGTLGAMYDRAFIVDASTDLTVAQEPATYTDLMAAAMGYFDEAVTLSAGATFTIPQNWMAVSLTNQELGRLAHSYKARYQAYEARTPAERAALNWNAIIADINAGIQDDHVITADWDNSYYWAVLDYGTWPSWTSATYFIWGMADQSGNYHDWLDLSWDTKGANFPSGDPVLIVTPDTRFPQGTTVAQQRADNDRNPYFKIMSESREGDTWKKPERGRWRWSWYKNDRMLNYGWDAVFEQSETRIAEMDLLKAEGLYRNGDMAGAAAIINETRVAAGLNATDAAGTNSSCVPKLPNGTCGDLWEMLKWEKRMETAHTALTGAGFWFDSRGWGDLWEETPLQFPVPCRELQVLQLMPCNTYGGPGGEMGAAKSTYAYPLEG